MAALNLQRGGLLASLLILSVAFLGTSVVHADAPSPEEDEPTAYETVTVPGQVHPSVKAVLSEDATCSDVVEAGMMGNIRRSSGDIECESDPSICFEYMGISFYGNATIAIDG
ncbi:hypothetical protein [Longimonas halophila]|uniref:hypothetical protein n=1 Tax=Longimonas halophila TaxID=1469170 RepID=UPI0011441045|nr:hypothetical protein [Longimonas halophila]